MTALRAVLIAVVFCTTAEAQATTALRDPPGRLYDVGGRRMHLLCSGEGSPTVVLEAGASSFAIDWMLVQSEVARSTRVCSYDRAGMGWSESSTPANQASVARDLHTLLGAAGEKAPYIMVGASRGGLFVRTYLSDYPDDVAGFVFVDPSTEDRLFTMVNGQVVAIAEVSAEALRATFPTQAVRVPRRNPQRGAPFDRLPAEWYAVRVQLDERLIASIPDTVPASVVAESQEAERALLAGLLASRRTGTPLGARPTVVLSRGDEPNADREASHAALARLSSNSRHEVIGGSGHEIHLFQPAAVVQATADVVRAVRENKPIPQRRP